MTNFNYKMLNQEAFTADHFDSDEFLTPLGGSLDHGKEYGLGIWEYHFEIEVESTATKDKRKFTIIFQPENRIDGIKAYAGHELDADCPYSETDELLDFCGHDDSILKELEAIAESEAKKELEKRILDL